MTPPVYVAILFLLTIVVAAIVYVVTSRKQSTKEFFSEGVPKSDSDRIAGIISTALGREAQSTEITTYYLSETSGDGDLNRLLASWKELDQLTAQREATGGGAATSTAENTVISVFYKVLKRVPTDAEKAVYAELIESGDLTADTLTIALEDSEAFKQMKKEAAAANTLMDTREHSMSHDERMRIKERLERSKDIIDVFEKVLRRMPSDHELARYRDQEGASMTTADIERHLESTEEYKRTQKMQSNMVHADLPGNLTEAQLRLHVTELYEKVHGSGARLSAKLFQFLKIKYVEYNLNDDRLLSLIQKIKDHDSGSSSSSSMPPLPTPMPASLPPLPQVQVQAPVQTPAPPAPAPVSAPANVTVRAPAPAPAPPAVISPSPFAAAPAPVSLSAVSAPSPVMEAYQDKYPATGSHALLEHVEAFDDKVDAQSAPCVDYNSASKLSEFMTDRNVDHLKNTCVRNTFYLDKDASIFPPLPSDNRKAASDVEPFQSRTQRKVHGTDLEAARDTKVGSILPRFIYKELDD